MKKEYEEMLHMDRPASRHPKMSLHDRAAQFAPFKSLTGYEDEVAETARLTEERKELTEAEAEVLGRKLQELQHALGEGEQPEALFSYFVADAYKKGGACVTAGGRLVKIDPYFGTLHLADGTVIPAADLQDIRINW